MPVFSLEEAELRTIQAIDRNLKRRFHPMALHPNGTDVLGYLFDVEDGPNVTDADNTNLRCIYRWSLLDPHDESPFLRRLAGDDEAPPELKDGLAADARFHTISSFRLLYGADHQPYIIVGDAYCIRVLRGAFVGKGESRVDTIGGAEALALAQLKCRAEEFAAQLQKPMSAAHRKAMTATEQALRAEVKQTISALTSPLQRTLAKLHAITGVTLLDFGVLVRTNSAVPVDTHGKELPGGRSSTSFFVLRPTADVLQPTLTLVTSAADGRPFMLFTSKGVSCVHAVLSGSLLHCGMQRGRTLTNSRIHRLSRDGTVDEGVEPTFSNFGKAFLREKIEFGAPIGLHSVLLHMDENGDDKFVVEVHLTTTVDSNGKLQSCHMRCQNSDGICASAEHLRDGALREACIVRPWYSWLLSPGVIVLVDEFLIRMIFDVSFLADQPELRKRILDEKPTPALLKRMQQAFEDLSSERIDQPIAAAAAAAEPSANGKRKRRLVRPSGAASDEDEPPKSSEEDSPQSKRPSTAADRPATLPSPSHAPPSAAPEPASAPPEPQAAAPAAAARTSHGAGAAAAAMPASVAPRKKSAQPRPAAAVPVRARPRAFSRRPRSAVIRPLAPSRMRVVQLEQDLDDVIDNEASTDSSSVISTVEWRRQYRAAIRAAVPDEDDDELVSTVPASVGDADDGAPIAGWIYVANATWQQFRPAGYIHRYECGFSTLPSARLRNFLTHEQEMRWFLTVPVTDVIRANFAALNTICAAGASIIPGRIKWFVFEDEAEAVAAAGGVLHPPLLPVVTTRMVLDWIRSAVAPWRDFTRAVHYGAGPAQHVQNNMLGLYNPDQLGRNRAALLPAMPAPVPAPAVVPPAVAAAAAAVVPVAVAALPPPPPAAVAVPAIGAHAPPAGAAAAHVSSAPVLLRGAELRAAVAAAAAEGLPSESVRGMRAYKHGVRYLDDGEQTDGDDDDDVETEAEEEEKEEERKAMDEGE
jgi:hypothetical protein